jgi:hypothetical protein
VVARRTEGDQGPVTISLAPTGSDLVIGQIISFAAILAGLVLLVRMPLAMLRARARPA